MEALVAEAVGARGETPLLVVHGAQDRLCALHEVQMLSARVPRGQLEVMQRCGHLSHEEDAQGLVACLGRFVRDVLAA